MKALVDSLVLIHIAFQWQSLYPDTKQSKKLLQTITLNPEVVKFAEVHKENGGRKSKANTTNSNGAQDKGTKILPKGRQA